MTLFQALYPSVPEFGLTSLSFLFLALPLFLFFYYVSPVRTRPGVLLVVSLVFCWLVMGENLGWVLVSLGADYGALYLMDRFDRLPMARRLCLWFVVGKNILIVALFDLAATAPLAGFKIGLPVLAVSAIDCALAVYRRENVCERSMIRFALYCLFFPRLYVGPLTTYDDFVPQVEGVRMSGRSVTQGAGMYIQGAFKAAVIGGSLLRFYESAYKIAQASALAAWCVVVSLAFILYYLLSGYSDMARGVGLMVGVKLPQNFYYPYQSRSMEDFFDRFNSTVTSFFRRVLPAEEGGDHLPGARILRLFAVGMLFGLWFGFRWNTLFWGIYLAIALILEQCVFRKIQDKIPVFMGRLLTLGMVLLGIPFLFSDTLGESLKLLGCIFSFSQVYNDQILYLLSSNWLLLAVSCVLATNLVSLISGKLKKAVPGLGDVFSAVFNFGILILYVALSL